MNGGAYGAGKAASGQGFDAVGFLMRPHVMLRSLCWLFSVVVFACISTEGWTSDGRCQYDGDDSACTLGNAVGVVGFLAASALLVCDALFDSFSSIKIRRRTVIADMAFCAAWAVMSFVAFCHLSNSWRRARMPYDGYGLNNVRAAIAFCFFAIPAWAGCSYLAYLRYKQGLDASQFMSTYDAAEQPAPDALTYGQTIGHESAVPGYAQAPFSQTDNNMVQQPAATNPFQAPSN
ncbi:synaptogyrin-like isoform X1 [Varroa jacobsoni]|uniref:Synaptogyrin n=1 Tax=Varroa destructor TaxID=109461 RepID=A0A7M7KIP7_VARDE|nr:synaptogyrin-like [Varroa destructor]XP_022698269.1 synaptogyrin-like isoform X1 [Varroa jacobsoni]XP_022698270.1 synaptogyrin-like isoform X1 [Varroa jacobsoni]